jgi:hypothetical protein
VVKSERKEERRVVVRLDARVVRIVNALQLRSATQVALVVNNKHKDYRAAVVAVQIAPVVRVVNVPWARNVIRVALAAIKFHW